MGKLIVELPDKIHSELKKKATLHHQTIKDIVTDLLEAYLSKSEEKKGDQRDRPLREVGRQAYSRGYY